MGLRIAGGYALTPEKGQLCNSLSAVRAVITANVVQTELNADSFNVAA